MRIVASAVWHKSLRGTQVAEPMRLTEIVPQPGQTPTVWIPEYEVHHDTSLHLLWCPPYSEENGWDEQPAEIALSHIVTGQIRRNPQPSAQSDASLKAVEVPCNFSVQGRMPFLDFMRAHAQGTESTTPSMPIHDPGVVWRNVRWCGTAEIGGYTYVSALSGEARIEWILQRRGAAMFIHYEQFWVDGWGDAAVGSWEVTAPVLQMVEDRLSRADVLLDRAPAA